MWRRGGGRRSRGWRRRLRLRCRSICRRRCRRCRRERGRGRVRGGGRGRRRGRRCSSGCRSACGRGNGKRGHQDRDTTVRSHRSSLDRTGTHPRPNRGDPMMRPSRNGLPCMTTGMVRVQRRWREYVAGLGQDAANQALPRHPPGFASSCRPGASPRLLAWRAHPRKRRDHSCPARPPPPRVGALPSSAIGRSCCCG